MSFGHLVPEDELLVHQVTETFASVGQSDRSWTEKVWATAFSRKGDLQVDFGLGVYPNRGVLDGFAGVSRGVEQWTVRASRELGRDGRPVVGPLAYRVDEPLRRVTFALAENDVLPLSFSCTFIGSVPAALEDRELRRSADGRRIDSDIVRFHQIGTAEGWVRLDGERTEFDASWVSTRDRSWGVRYMIGAPPADLPRLRRPRGGGSLTIWAPVLCERADGSRYGLHLYYHCDSGPGRHRVEVQGGVEDADGRTPFRAVEPALRFDPGNRRLLGGVLSAVTDDGQPRPLTVTTLGATGFQLGAGLYFGLDGQWHGQWRGPLHVEGEHTPDCSAPEAARRLHQIRDCIVWVDDPVGGGTGWGNMQTIATGAPAGTDLADNGSFL